MTAHSLPLLRRIQILLNTLVGERRVRRSLLHEVVELTSATDYPLSAVHDAAAELLETLERYSEVEEFDAAVSRISSFMCTSTVLSEEAPGGERVGA
jgi:hypothetical protein